MIRIFLLLVAVLLGHQTAIGQVPLSGSLAGELPPGHYVVDEFIWVAEADSLSILPPAELVFAPGISFVVDGHLSAVGAEGDSILFLGSDWDGLKFLESVGRCRLSHCRISGSVWSAINCRDSTLELEHVEISANAGPGTSIGPLAGGLYAIRSDLTLLACNIAFNEVNSYESGSGGLYLSDSSALIEDCVIADNTEGLIPSKAGGLYAHETELVLRRCRIARNISEGRAGGLGLSSCPSPRVEACEIFDNEGGGGDLWYCTDVRLEDCRITGNRSIGGGGGLSSRWTDVTLVRCVVANNYSPQDQYGSSRGGGILSSTESRLTLQNCTLAGNIAGGYPSYGNGICIEGAWAGDPNLILRSCIVAGNRGNGGGVYTFGGSVSASIGFCDFWNNEGGDFTGAPQDTLIGIILGENPNGDPCDGYGNIYIDPLLSEEYRLGWLSPCIDAGFPTDPHDPDGTPADQGAFYRDQVVAADDPPPASSNAARLLPAWPNPCNPTTRIAFDLPDAGRVRLTLHDASGRLLRVLRDGPEAAGHHELVWNCRDGRGADLPSGVYLCRLDAGGATRTRRVVLLK